MSTACSQSDIGFNIPFEATWNGAPIRCADSSPALSDLRFYVSNVQLVDANGKATDVRLATEYWWQNDAVALIDLEEGVGACLNGTQEVTTRIVAVAPPGEYRGLRFTVGVPFRLNHRNPLAAAPPLDDSAMHWHWRSGYKFLRAGVRTEHDSFWIHVGSAGCEGTVGHISGCKFPNRIEVDLVDFRPGHSSVVIDLGALLSGTRLDDNAASNCSSGPPEASCRAPFAALGIDFETGKQSGSQHVFSAQ